MKMNLLGRPTKQNHYVVISDDVLVADMRLAKTAGLVRLKLEDLTFAHFYVRADDQGAKLGFTTGRDDFVVLGIFADRANADNLLNEIRSEMLKIETLHKFFSMRTFLTAMSLIITLIFLVWFVGKITQQNLPQLNEPLALEEQYPGPITGPAVEPGKPMDADSKLSVPE
jgi:hypothetical protein